MGVPSYLAATVKSPTQAGQINQFLTTHTTDYVYAGTVQTAQTTGSGLYASTNGTYLAQSFITGSSQTAVGQVWLQLSTVGGSPTTATITPLSVSVYTNAAGIPGTVLATTVMSEMAVYSSPFWLQVPFSLSGLTASTQYQIVVAAAGGSSSYYAWQKSNQVSGGSTSPDGVTWTGQTYGLMYQVYDQTSGGNIQYLISDGGTRWTQFAYDSLGRYTTITENTVAQDGSVFQSVRSFTYTSGLLTGVA